jgi:hypothetical protein
MCGICSRNQTDNQYGMRHKICAFGKYTAEVRRDAKFWIVNDSRGKTTRQVARDRRGNVLRKDCRVQRVVGERTPNEEGARVAEQPTGGCGLKERERIEIRQQKNKGKKIKKKAEVVRKSKPRHKKSALLCFHSLVHTYRTSMMPRKSSPAAMHGIGSCCVKQM